MKRLHDGASGSNPACASNSSQLYLRSSEYLGLDELKVDLQQTKIRWNGLGYGIGTGRAVGELVFQWILDRSGIAANGDCKDYVERYVPFNVLQQLSRTIHGIRRGCWFDGYIKSVHPYGVLISKLDADCWAWFVAADLYSPFEWVKPEDNDSKEMIAKHPEGYMEISHYGSRGKFDAIKKTIGLWSAEITGAFAFNSI